jgi:hypothetical protein
MAITKDQYKTSEEIVGPKRIPDDPVIMYPYSWRIRAVCSPGKLSHAFCS